MENQEKEYSLRSTSTGVAPAAGIDSEVEKFFTEHGDVSKGVVIDDATNRRLRMLVHKRVLVVMVFTYFIQALDKGTINFASIMGIREDTNLVGQQYAWLTTIVYIAILVFELPTNLLIQRLPIAKYLGFNVIAWGAVLATTAATKNFAGLMVVRFLLGLFECVCQPAFVFLSTMYYTRDEQGLVIGSFYSMNGMQQCLGGLLAYGVAHVKNQPLKNWQVLFTLLGCITVGWGFFVLSWLPDSPMRATCWSPEDKIMIAERVRKNETGIQNKEFKAYQAVEALKDLTVWGVTIVSFTNALPTGGMGAFSNILLNSFGFSIFETYLLAIAQGVIIMLFLFSSAFLSKKMDQRLALAGILTLPNVAGTVVFLCVQVTSQTKIGLLLAFYCCQAFAAVAILNLSILSGNVAGRTKQSVASTAVFIAWAVGNAIGPQVFRDNDRPRYLKAFIAHLVVYAVQLVTIMLLRVRLMRLNVLKRRAQSLDETGSDERIEHRRAFDDMTDWENNDFRYVY